jgi:Fe-Mn family superoxide dismutase
MNMNPSVNRRRFLSTTAKGSLALGLGLASIPAFLESCSATKKIASKGPSLGFDQTPLPYAYDALENVIDKMTMEIHYTKHAAAYSKALKEAVAAEAPGVSQVEPLLATISKYSAKMRNNAGGHYNHEMFWKSMRPKRTDNAPSGKLLAAIEGQFGSVANMRSQFNEAAKSRFGSGWAWLYLDRSNILKIGSTPNQDNPLMNISDIQGYPILGLDVWEHAYYLKYQNKRADYVENWWNVVNWDMVEQRFAFGA